MLKARKGRWRVTDNGAILAPTQEDLRAIQEERRKDFARALGVDDGAVLLRSDGCMVVHRRAVTQILRREGLQ